MVCILDQLKQARCFEWGPGHSTEIMSTHPNVVSVDSVESDPFYLDMVKRRYNVSKANLMLEQDYRYYPLIAGDHAPYDLVFVDGRYRRACLAWAKKILKGDGVVLLHDAERNEYVESINTFNYQIYTDVGNTVTLLNNMGVYENLKEKLSNYVG